jgi:signal transduction histidine kinase
VLTARMEMQASLQLARDQITQLSRQVMELKLKLDDERSRLATLVGDDGDSSLSISQRLNAITDEHRELREERDRLTKQLQDAEAALHGATASDNEAIVNNMIEALRKEKDALLSERERLQAQLEAVQQANPGDAPVLVQRMLEEKGMLEHERNQLYEKLNTIQTQLQALGIDDGVSGLPGLIGRLYEERALLKSSLEKTQHERDTLLTERTRIAGNITNEKERDTFITSLQLQLQNLAADREAALKQRDKMRAEREEVEEKINQVKAHRARLMAQTAALEEELTEVREEQTRLRAEVQEVADARSEVFGERDRLMAEVQRLRTAYEQLEARAEGDPMRMQRLGEEGVNTLKQMVDELTTDRARLESELSRSRLARNEVEEQLSLSQRMAAVNTEEDAQEAHYKPVQPDLMMSLVQELRTPMTSINGYVDLLLGESAGILGEMQRKFLQRVSANVSRLASMIEDLVHVTELDTEKYEFQPAPVDVVNLIENAITNSSIQFREKGLGITFNLAEDLPPLPADKDALTQIIGQMLTNAYLVSPPDTEVMITAQRRLIKLNARADHDTDCVYVAVEDRGGGIAMEDIPRVFVRKYKAENPLIAGLGDTGVGLSMAKALVEAHGGQLWLETKPGLGSIFSFALPLVSAAEG